jgi:hypothetical protein
MIRTIREYLVDLNLERSGRILIIIERKKIERAEIAGFGPSSARPAQLGCPRTLTKKGML